MWASCPSLGMTVMHLYKWRCREPHEALQASGSTIPAELGWCGLLLPAQCLILCRFAGCKLVSGHGQDRRAWLQWSFTAKSKALTRFPYSNRTGLIGHLKIPCAQVDHTKPRARFQSWWWCYNTLVDCAKLPPNAFEIYFWGWNFNVFTSEELCLLTYTQLSKIYFYVCAYFLKWPFFSIVLLGSLHPLKSSVQTLDIPALPPSNWYVVMFSFEFSFLPTPIHTHMVFS